MSPVVKLLICASAILAMAAETAGLECYSCSTKGDDTCDAEAKISKLSGSDCKACVKIQAETNDATANTYSCSPIAPADDSEGKCKEDNVLGLKTVTCYCSSNLCNGVGRLSGSVLVVLAVAMFKYLW